MLVVISPESQEPATPETSSHTRKRACTASPGKEYIQAQSVSSSSVDSANFRHPAQYRPILPAGKTGVSSAISPAAQLDPFEPQATMGQQAFIRLTTWTLPYSLAVLRCCHLALWFSRLIEPGLSISYISLSIALV